ncbi:hypothetical protein ABKV19_001890 [Rosa sericea]
MFIKIAEATAYGNDGNEGSDCVHPFVILQNCIKANPNAFSNDISEEDGVKKEENLTQDYKIIPPSWSKESPSPKSKL